MVADFVDHGNGNLARDLVLVVALGQDGQPVDRDRVGQRERVVRQALGERGAPVDAEQHWSVGILVGGLYDHIVQQPEQSFRNRVERIVDKHVEARP
jgi:hypothetical protein